MRSERQLPARRQAAFRPVDPGLALPSGSGTPSALGSRQVLESPHPDAPAAASECCRELASLSERPSVWEWARHREPVIPSAQARPGGRTAVYRGGRPAPHQACCPEPALRSARGLQLALGWPPEQARPVVPAGLRGQASASRSVLAPDGLEEPLREGVPVVASEPGERRMARAAVRRVPVRVAAESPRAAGPAAWAPCAGRAVPVAAVSERAAAGPQPEAAKAALELPAAEVAAAEPAGPQGVAEAAAVQPGAAVRLPEEVRRADVEVRPQAAARPGARVRKAARLSAAPSAAASVFRQGPRLAAGPARPRTAKRLARAMRSWPVASR